VRPANEQLAKTRQKTDDEKREKQSDDYRKQEQRAAPYFGLGHGVFDTLI